MKPLYYDYDSVRRTHGDDIADAVRELQSLFTDGLPRWFAGLWDNEIGAFYYSNSARDNDGFLPDIESSMQALGNMRDAGMADTYADFPHGIAKKVCAFAQGLQDPEDGFFYHPQWEPIMRKNMLRYSPRRSRDLGNALGLIAAGGGKPLYVDANTRIREAAASESTEDDVLIPEHLRSEEAFRAFLDSLDINAHGRSYPGGHRISAQVAQIAAAGLTDVCFDFLNSHQFENGMWENELSYAASNGLMKISCAYRTLKRDMPRLEEALDAAIKVTLLDTRPGAITDIYNTFYTIENVFMNFEMTGNVELIERGKARLRESAAEIIRVTKRKLEIFAKPDGSFSYCPYMSCITSQAVPASLGAYEGDVNATVIAIGTRRRCLTQLGIPAGKLYGEAERRIFSDVIAENIARGKAPKQKPLVSDYDRIAAEHGEEIAEITRYMNQLYTDGLVKWLAEMWDAKTGGFYYSKSARDNPDFLPDLESTGQAMGHLEMLGIVDDFSELPIKMRDKLIEFCQSRQDPEDGYFYHPQWGKDINVSRRGRDMSNACDTLKMLGSEPLYPTALERISNAETDEKLDTVPPHLRSKEAFAEYLRELDLPSDPYSKGHILASEASQIRAAGLADMCAEYLNSTQLDNGMWREEYDYMSANGLLKISGAYEVLGKEFPNPTKALSSAIRIAMSTTTATCMVEIYNPICAIRNIFSNVERMGDPELLTEAREMLRQNARYLIKYTREKLGIFRKPDGSYSYLYNKSTPISQKVCVSLGLDEGDMNAVALADSSRARLFDILGIDAGKICTPEARAEFFRIINEKLNNS